MRPAFTKLVDLAVAQNGGVVASASDDFFAPKERLIMPEAPVTRPGVYTENGKWMDGWESRRRRTAGNDWCVVRLGFRGLIRGVDIDTSYFVGNHPPEASIEVRDGRDKHGSAEDWKSVLERVPLKPDEHNLFEVSTVTPVTHVRLNIYPDGGVARLRVYGEVEPDWSAYGPSDILEISSLAMGGLPLACSDEHFGRMMNLLQLGPALNMSDGWETRRRRVPGHDWVVIRLGATAMLDRLEVDTSHFKGNYPDRCSVDACLLGPESEIQDAEWRRLLGESKLEPDALHTFPELSQDGPFDHLRLNIYPDGGVARFRAFGQILPSPD